MRAVGNGDDAIAEYLDRYVYSCPDHFEYLDRIGLRRLFDLAEFR